MAKVMVSFDAEVTPSLDEVRRRFSLTADEIDESFGVIEVDPDTHTHTVLVEEQAAARITGKAWGTTGPFSNPKIAPFGPPRR